VLFAVKLMHPFNFFLPCIITNWPSLKHTFSQLFLSSFNLCFMFSFQFCLGEFHPSYHHMI
jgi:hypothetical protein